MRKYLVVKCEHKGSHVLVKCLSRRAAQAYIEEVVLDACYLYQGSIPPQYIGTKYERKTTSNTSSLYFAKSYGFFVQTCEDIDVFTCWFRNRKVGIFMNSWVDEKLFTLSIVEQKSKKLITPIYDGLYPINNVHILPKRPFIQELGFPESPQRVEV